MFIDSATFMASSLSNLEGVHRIKFKFGHGDKKCETCRIVDNSQVLRLFS